MYHSFQDGFQILDDGITNGIVLLLPLQKEAGDIQKDQSIDVALGLALVHQRAVASHDGFQVAVQDGKARLSPGTKTSGQFWNSP